MKHLLPSLTAFAVVAFVATVGYAETITDQDAETEVASVVVEAAVVEASDPESNLETVEPTDKVEAAGNSGTESEALENESASDESPTDPPQPDNDSAEPSQGSANLSVAPLTHITYPDDWPSWADAERNIEGSNHTWPVTTGGCKTIEACEDKLMALLRANIALYIKECYDWNCDECYLSDQAIREILVARRYEGTITKGDEELKEIAVELRFDPEAQALIQRAVQNDQLDGRLRASGGLFAITIIGLFCSGGILGVISRRFS
ncbi:hypothetical protein [Rhodopirellula sp. MGV]|uniref:hypothetical protein n=1 Tax=Rhodopirellula sp. MGV TaxID=2023130 RepID=UPI000B97B650|nr:hypothetical protein [Rhodopirellula sp. MGV]OYP31715.1 hypothetical protein CGZ80_20690 [Rhodopirellula sp. MGV]PNY34015.1 hypothetical protein C2E31_25635 [Rhodopirellula baltica]